MTASTRRTRKLPFLHRNYIKSTNHWHAKMGNKTSSLSPGYADKFPEQDDQGSRPAKRRRVTGDCDGFPLFPGYAATSMAMRLEILKITHMDSPRFKNGIMNGREPPPNVKSMRVKCKITIFTQKAGHQVCLHVDSQICDINIYKNPAGSTPIARLSAIQPFHIPVEKISLQRDDDDSFGLANSYGVLIELESVGDPKWPPLELIPANDEDTFSNRLLPPRQWLLTGTIPDIFNSRHRKTMRLRVRKHTNHETATNFIMDVDARWLTAISRQLAMSPKDKDIQPSITVFDPNEPIMPLTTDLTDDINGVTVIDEPVRLLMNGEADMAVQANGTALDLLDDLAEGELTPTRSRRTRRISINYNVRQLWRNAVGKENPRKRPRPDDKQGQPDDHTVTYKLHFECLQAPKFQCVLCGAEHDRISQLRAHAMSHPRYDFHFEHKVAEGWVASVRPHNPNDEINDNALTGRVYQLGLPTKPLDLDSYVEGDTSWVDSRLGPSNGETFGETPQLARPQQKRAIKRHQKRIFVPNIRQPIYDPLSKAPLLPGTEIRQPPVDDEWLVLKHRDTLQDFTDVEESEKEYMKEWDSYILRSHLSSEAYLPRAFLMFVRERANWIVALKSRAEEFSKHVSVLLARRAIDEATLQEATAKVNEARSNKTPEPPKLEIPKPKDPESCNICGELVPVSEILICANKQCANRLYHDTCVDDPEEAKQKGRHWVCKTCS